MTNTPRRKTSTRRHGGSYDSAGKLPKPSVPKKSDQKKKPEPPTKTDDDGMFGSKKSNK